MTMVVHGSNVLFSHSQMGSYGVEVQSDGTLTMEDIDTAAVTVAGNLLADHVRLTNSLTVEGSGDIDVSNLIGRRLVVSSGAAGAIRVDGARLIGSGSGSNPIVTIEAAALQEVTLLGLLLGRKSTATFQNHLILNEATGAVVEATSWRATQAAAVLTDCEGCDLDLKVKGPATSADNTHPAVQLAGACDEIDLRGSVRGGAPYNSGGNEPSYGVDVGASCTDIDIWMTITGVGTAPINDLTTGEVTVH